MKEGVLAGRCRFPRPMVTSARGRGGELAGRAQHQPPAGQFAAKPSCKLFTNTLDFAAHPTMKPFVI